MLTNRIFLLEYNTNLIQTMKFLDKFTTKGWENAAAATAEEPKSPPARGLVARGISALVAGALAATATFSPADASAQDNEQEVTDMAPSESQAKLAVNTSDTKASSKAVRTTVLDREPEQADFIGASQTPDISANNATTETPQAYTLSPETKEILENLAPGQSVDAEVMILSGNLNVRNAEGFEIRDKNLHRRDIITITADPDVLVITVPMIQRSSGELTPAPDGYTGEITMIDLVHIGNGEYTALCFLSINPNINLEPTTQPGTVQTPLPSESNTVDQASNTETSPVSDSTPATSTSTSPQPRPTQTTNPRSTVDPAYEAQFQQSLATINAQITTIGALAAQQITPSHTIPPNVESTESQTADTDTLFRLYSVLENSLRELPHLPRNRTQRESIQAELSRLQEAFRAIQAHESASRNLPSNQTLLNLGQQISEIEATYYQMELFLLESEATILDAERNTHYAELSGQDTSQAQQDIEHLRRQAAEAQNELNDLTRELSNAYDLLSTQLELSTSRLDIPEVASQQNAHLSDQIARRAANACAVPDSSNSSVIEFAANNCLESTLQANAIERISEVPLNDFINMNPRDRDEFIGNIAIAYPNNPGQARFIARQYINVLSPEDITPIELWILCSQTGSNRPQDLITRPDLQGLISTTYENKAEFANQDFAGQQQIIASIILTEGSSPEIARNIVDEYLAPNLSSLTETDQLAPWDIKQAISMLDMALKDRQASLDLLQHSRQARQAAQYILARFTPERFAELSEERSALIREIFYIAYPNDRERAQQFAPYAENLGAATSEPEHSSLDNNPDTADFTALIGQEAIYTTASGKQLAVQVISASLHEQGGLILRDKSTNRQFAVSNDTLRRNGITLDSEAEGNNIAA